MVDVEATKRAFKGLIDKPALTDALLNRPPFKFILDIVANTIAATGYLKTQFPKADLSPAALSDKTAKTSFLDKLISSVDDGSLSQVKSAKIVAGKDPELTNKLLVKFAENARSHMSEGPPTKEKKSSSKERSSSKDRSKDKESKEKSKSSSSKDKEKSSRSSSKDPKKEKKEDKKDKEPRSKSKDRDDKEKKKSKKHHSDDGKEKKKHKERKEHAEEPPSTSEIEVPPVDMNSNFVDKESDEGFEEALRSESPILTEKLSPGNDSGVGELHERLHLEPAQHERLPPPPAEREFQRPTTAAARPQTSMGRPGTAAARPAPPKLKKKHLATTEETAVVPESKVNILGEETEKEKQEDHDFVVEEPVQEEPLIPDMMKSNKIEAEEGGLVQKMMETKAGLEEGQLLDDIDEDDSEFAKEMQKVQELQKTLQNVTRTTYPLAHIFEYAQEDLESMMRELEKWRAETRANESELKDRESAGIGEAHKLSNMLTSLEEEIRSVKSNLTNVKARVVTNEDRIRVLMNDV